MKAVEKSLAFEDLLHLVFISVASLVLLAWLLRLEGGDPFDLIRAPVLGLVSPLACARCLDLTASLLIAAIGCSLAAKSDKMNIGAEGQFILGFVLASYIADCFCNSPLSCMVLAVIVSIFLGAAAGLVCFPSSILTSSGPGASTRGVGVDGHCDGLAPGIIFNLFVYSLLVGSTFDSKPVLFPLLDSSPSPKSGVLAALALFLFYRYLMGYMTLGIELRCSGYGKTELLSACSVGALCSLGGAFCCLSGCFGEGSPIGPFGLGVLALASSLLTRRSLEILLPLVLLFNASVVSGWKGTGALGSSSAAFALCLLLLISFLKSNIEGDGA